MSLGLVAMIVFAWAYLLREASVMDATSVQARMHVAVGMAGMNTRAWSASDWIASFLMWSVMMIGTMLPSAAPVIMLVLGAYRLRSDARARMASVAFIGG